MGEAEPNVEPVKTSSSRRRLLVILAGALLLLVLAVCAWVAPRLLAERRRWAGYVRDLKDQPGIVVVQAGRRDGRPWIQGLRDPLAIDPVALLSRYGFDRARVRSEWQPYQSLAPELLIARLRTLLAPPVTVVLSVTNGVLTARGLAPLAWIEQARAVSRVYPGITGLDTNGLTATDSEVLGRWSSYVERLRGAPGITVIEAGFRDGRFQISGLRDPAAEDPEALLDPCGVPRDLVASSWKPYQAAAPELARRREAMVLRDNAKAEPDAAATPSAAPEPAENVADAKAEPPAPSPADEKWERFVERLKSEPGVCVVEQGRRNGLFYVSGLRDALSADPESLMQEFDISPKSVTGRWEFYQASSPRFTLLRAEMLLAPPESVTLALEEDVLVARGSAPYEWVRAARLLSRSVPGVAELRTTELQISDVSELAGLKERVERQSIRFEPQTARPAAGQDGALEVVAESIRRMHALCLKLDADLAVEIAGSVQAGDKENLPQLGRNRAHAVAELLAAQGVKRDTLSPQIGPAGGPAPADAVAGARATFRVRFVGLPQ